LWKEKRAIDPKVIASYIPSFDYSVDEPRELPAVLTAAVGNRIFLRHRYGVKLTNVDYIPVCADLEDYFVAASAGAATDAMLAQVKSACWERELERIREEALKERR
jgi:hypothetical protein